MSEPLFTDHERQGAVWQKLKRHLEERLATMRAKNDGNLDEMKTARLRGQIAEVKALMSFGTDKPVVGIEDANYKD